MSEQPISLPELAELHGAMTAAMQQAIPQAVNVQAYPVLEQGMKMPALFYAMTSIAPGDDPGDGRVCVLATFEACVLVESDREQAPLQAAVLASKLVKLLHQQYWALDFVDHVRDVQAMPSEALPELVQCAAWSVTWRQPIYLGETEWLWPDEPPGTLKFAFSPNTGSGQEGQYFEPESLT